MSSADDLFRYNHLPHDALLLPTDTELHKTDTSIGDITSTDTDLHKTDTSLGDITSTDTDLHKTDTSIGDITSFGASSRRFDMTPRYNPWALPLRPLNRAQDTAQNSFVSTALPPRPVAGNHGNSPTTQPIEDRAPVSPNFSGYYSYSEWQQYWAQLYQPHRPSYDQPQAARNPPQLGFFQQNIGNPTIQSTHPNHPMDSVPERLPYDSRSGTCNNTSNISLINDSARSSVHSTTHAGPVAAGKGKGGRRKPRSKKKGKAKLDEASTAPGPAQENKRSQDPNMMLSAPNAAQGNSNIQATPPAPGAAQRKKRGEAKIMLPAPHPSPAYLAMAAQEPSFAANPNRLLVILDLNGTLIFRPSNNGQNMIARPFLEPFLRYLFENFAVMVWSSARPHNVKALVEKVLSKDLLSKLVAYWARDTLNLTAYQYQHNVQVYKMLDIVWDSEDIQYHNPGYDRGMRFGQHNTVLIDDSALKASAQPHNLLEIPEFQASPEDMKSDVLREVAGYLDVLRMQQDVSRFIRKEPFKANGRWTFSWPDAAAQDGQLKEAISLQGTE